MRSFRFLHTADLHLGSPFHGLRSRLPEVWSSRVRNAADEVFRRVVDIAIEERVDFVTLAGDVFDSPSVPMRAWFELQRGLQRLCDAGIPVFLSHGNHDPLTGPSPIAWPDNVHVFPAVDVEPTGPVPSAWCNLAGDTRIQISGFSYSQSAMTASYAPAFVRDPAADFAIGLYHGSVGAVASAEHATYCPTSVQELALRGYDIFALGHIHQPMVLADARPLVFYPGVPQGRHIREPGWHGVSVVDVNEQGRPSVRGRRTASVTFATVEVDVDGVADLGHLPRLVTAALCDPAKVSSGARSQPTSIIDGTENHMLPTIARMYLTGVTAMAYALPPADDLCDLLVEDLQVQGLPVFLESLHSELVPPLERDTLAQSSEFIGEFLRLIDECREDPDQAKRLLAAALEPVFHDGSGLTLADPGEDGLQTLLDAAERQVLTWYAAAAMEEESR